MKKRILSLLLAVAVISTLLPAALASGVYTDTDGHWGETSIDRWTAYGVVGGYGDEFHPEGEMTRAELARVLVNLLGLQQTAGISQYQDVKPGDWFYDDIAKCVAAGILNGVGSNMEPNRKVTREEMFTMFARALGIAPKNSSSAVFADGGEVSGWAAGYINALADMGVVTGVGGGKLDPGANINRASVMTVLDKAISEYANTNGATVGTSTGIVLVVADQVTVSGNVENLVVAGSGNTVTLSGGNTASVAVVGQNSTVNVSSSAAAGEVTISEQAAGTVVNVAKGAAVASVDSKADGVTIAGEGTVETALVSGSNTAVNTDGTDLTVAPGAVGVTENTKPVAGGDTVETEPLKGQTGATTPAAPVIPVVPVPTYYTVNFVAVDGQAIGSPAYVQTGSAVTAPEIAVAEGEKVTWYNGAEPVDLSNLAVAGDMTLTAVVGSDDFAAGNGTQAYPYLISNAEQFAAIKEVDTSAQTYYKQTADIAVSETELALNGIYNGGGHAIRLADNVSGYRHIFEYTYGEDTRIENLILTERANTVLALVWMNKAVSLTVKDIQIASQDNATLNVNSNNFGFILANAMYEKWDNTPNCAQTVLFENIVNNVNVTNTGTCTGVFVASGPCFNFAESSVTYRNCVNNGTVTGTENVGLLYGNGSYIACIETANQFVIENCKNNGSIIATAKNGAAEMCPKASTNTVLTYCATPENENYISGSAIGDNTFCAYSSDDKFAFVTNGSSDYSYKLVFNVQAINWSDGYVSNGIKVLVDAATVETATEGLTTFTAANCHAYDINTAKTKGVITEDEAQDLTVNASGAYGPCVIIKDNNVYIIFLNTVNQVEGTVDSNVSLYAYAYNAAGALVGIKNF